jgi:hypothetical protein
MTTSHSTPPAPRRFRVILIVAALLAIEAVTIVAVMNARAESEYARRRSEIAGEMLKTRFMIDGCEFVVDQQADTTVGKNQLVHADSCRNPVHWKHVLSDTSWYGKVNPM